MGLERFFEILTRMKSTIMKINTYLFFQLDTVIHEMCHAIGMVHEQSRSDRDKYVKIITENIRSDYIYNLRKHKTYDLDAYDYESVMQYGLKDQDLEFLADAANGLTFYDAQDINHFYECAKACKNPPKCENGGYVNHVCKCSCPSGLTGERCESVITDNDCGGIVEIGIGDEKVITSPNYPENYPTGKRCKWLIKGPVAKERCLSFHYFMYGKTVKTLNVYKKDATVENSTKLVWTKSGDQGQKWICANITISSNSDLKVDIAIHEMCHAIGMAHEQSRSDRDDYVTIMWENMGGKNGNFNKGNTYDVNEYDYESVMQYGLWVSKIIAKKILNQRYINTLCHWERVFARSYLTFNFYDVINAFSQNGKQVIHFKDKNLEFLAYAGDGLTFYDAEDINVNYECTKTCNNPPKCEHGGYVNHMCKCTCPTGITGQRCETIITDNGCGGIVEVGLGGEQVITSPNYPENYNTGTLCRWLVQGPPGWYIKLTVEHLHLPDDGMALNRCYHWLEIRYNLLGQKGIKRCGDMVGHTYVTTKDELSNEMLIIFDSKFANDKAARKGFRLLVEPVGRGCRIDPCVYGVCKESTIDCNYKCICNRGFSGKHCDELIDDTNLECSFDYHTKCFMVNSLADDFQWALNSGPTSTLGTGPDRAYRGTNYMYAEMSLPRKEGDKAVLVSNLKFPGMNFSCNYELKRNRCFVKYHPINLTSCVINISQKYLFNFYVLYELLIDKVISQTKWLRKLHFNFRNLLKSFIIRKERCLSFYYYMFGKTVKTLNVYVEDAAVTNSTTLIWTKSGNQGSRWIRANVSIDEYTDLKLFVFYHIPQKF
ncbi:hypothetical protein KUTeg_023511 [Tegillarca granosa]|uniref:Metalloendopeptidase n=1 Tax=Tegillarca granosa TaxID=220873 RepID=A0ABQ9E1U7_TEGGR|nr:hypothetical protein KUTeg_023511 [Tegillarca granosa]